MKRSKLIIFFIIFSVIIITGCSTKEAKLICKQTANNVDVEYNVGFKGNIIDTMSFNYVMDLSSYTDLQINAISNSDFCTTVKNSMADYKNAFTNCNQKIEDKHLKVEALLDVDKISKNAIGKMASPEKGKEALEEVGYTCTIEK